MIAQIPQVNIDTTDKKESLIVWSDTCRSCGIRFGKDNRSFRYDPDKVEPICFNCEIKR